ncbi:class I SAM-dependent methyltransferase [candidate division KSB1 bacterium]|nr:class I SAM-dependent methyltransferase [candidate division KSB1 bacterium]
MDQKKYYESVAQELNLWSLDKRQNRYFQDMIRYDNILKLIPRQRLTILDLGCGDGYLSYLMAQKGHRVTSLDLSQARLDKFRQIAEDFGITQKTGDIKHTGIDEQTFDLIVSSEVLEHIEGYEEAIIEAYRLLKPGGLFIVSVPHDEPLKQFICPHCLKSFYRDGHVNRFNRVNLPQALAEQGLEIEKIKTVRSKILNQLQYHLKLKYGSIVKLLDRFLVGLLPRYTFYLITVARKPRA